MKNFIRHALLALSLLVGLVPAFAAVPPPIPALPDTSRLTTYTPTASTGPFNVSFDVYGDGTDYGNWVEVWVNGAKLTPGTQWTLDSPSGQLNLIPRPLTDARVTLTTAATGTVQIVGARRPRRVSQFSVQPTVRDFNQVLTDLTSQNREVWDLVQTRTLRAPPGTSLGYMPPPASCLGKYLGFDATGSQPVCTPGGAGSGNVVGPATATIGNIPVFALADGSLLADGGNYANHGMVVGRGAGGGIGSTISLTNGQFLIGQTGADPAPTLISGGATVSASGVLTIANNYITNAMLSSSIALDTTKVAHTAPGTGAVAITQAAIDNYVYYATAYGAACTGGDDAAALQRAFNAVGATGGTLMFPPGGCSSSAKLTLPGNTNVALRGQGRGMSNLTFTGATGGIQYGTIASGYPLQSNGSAFYFEVTGLNIQTNQTGAHVGIIMYCPYFPSLNLSQFKFEDLNFQPVNMGSTSQYFADGIYVNNCWRGVISNTHLSQSIGTIAGRAINLDGLSPAVQIDHVATQGWDKGVNMGWVAFQSFNGTMTGTFSYGELVTGNTSGCQSRAARVGGAALAGSVLNAITVVGIPCTNGETVTGQTSGATISSITQPTITQGNEGLYLTDSELLGGNYSIYNNSNSGAGATLPSLAMWISRNNFGCLVACVYGRGTYGWYINDNLSFASANNAKDIDLFGGGGVNIQNNSFNSDAFTGRTAVYLDQLSNVMVTGNNIGNRGTGIYYGPNVINSQYPTGNYIDTSTVTTPISNASAVINPLSIATGKTLTASNTLTFTGTDGSSVNFGAGGTMLSAAGTATFTNKTFDTAGAGNSFLINGVAATANTGTGALARATSPVFVTPTLGAATGTSLQLSGLTASSALATDASKNLVSVTNTGTGNNVLAASPALTGVPTAPTAAANNNSTQIATTAYADAIAALKANIASPTFTGTPAAPTATLGTNTTQIATTAFVAAAVTAGTAGVASIDTKTGAITLGNGLQTSANVLSVDQTAWSTYSPSLACDGGAGTFGSASAAGRYKQIGKTVHVNITLTVTTIGTCTAYATIGLPFTANSNGTLAGVTANTGMARQATINQSTSVFTTSRYDNANIGITTGQVAYFQGTYETP